jgi:hypothetical protein
VVDIPVLVFFWGGGNKNTKWEVALSWYKLHLSSQRVFLFYGCTASEHCKVVARLFLRNIFVIDNFFDIRKANPHGFDL